MKKIGNFKKWCSAVLTASVLAVSVTATGFSVSAAAPWAADLMPLHAEAVTGGDAAMENGTLILKAGATDTHFTWEPNCDVYLNEMPNLYFDLQQTGGFNIQIKTTSANADTAPTLSSDFGNLEILGAKGGGPDVPNGLGTLITTESIKAINLVGDNEIPWIGAYTWSGCPNPLPVDGRITVKSVTVTVGANGTMNLDRLYLGQEPFLKEEEKTYYNPYTAAVDVDLLSRDLSQWQTMELGAVGDNDYGDNLSHPALLMQASGTGLKMTMSAELGRDDLRFWYPARAAMEQKGVSISGRYLYYSIKSTYEWSLHLVLGDDLNNLDNTIRLTSYIAREKNPGLKVIYEGSGDRSKTFAYDQDAVAGAYIGRLDLEKVIGEAVRGNGQENGGKLPDDLLKDGKIDVSGAIVWVVGPAGAAVSVDKLFIGTGGEQSTAPVFGNGVLPPTDPTTPPSIDEETVNLLPTDISQWQTMEIDAPNDYAYGDNLSNPALVMEAGSNGLKITMSDKIDSSTARTWYPARALVNQKGVSIHGKYLYYNIKATGNWNLNLVLGDDPTNKNGLLKLAAYIAREQNPELKVIYNSTGKKGETFGYDEDGTPGTYIGRLDLEQVIGEAIQSLKIHDSLVEKGKVDICATVVWAVGRGASTSVEKLLIASENAPTVPSTNPSTDPTVTDPSNNPSTDTTTVPGSTGSTSTPSTSQATNTVQTENPKTGDSLAMAASCTVLALAAAGAVALTRKSRRNHSA